MDSAFGFLLLNFEAATLRADVDFFSGRWHNGVMGWCEVGGQLNVHAPHLR